MVRSIFWFIVLVSLASCGGSDSTVISSDGKARILIDSTILRQWTADSATAEWSEPLLRFYRQRQFTSAWYVDDSLIPMAETLMVSVEWAVNEGLDTNGWGLTALRSRMDNQSDPARADVDLSKTYFRFALFEAFGVLRNQPKPHWEHPQRHLDLVACLDSIVSANAPLAILSPRHSEYHLLRSELRALVNQDDWRTDLAVASKIEPGTRSAIIPRIRRRLGITQPTDSMAYDSSLVKLVKTFQYRYGQNPDGVIGSGTVAAMNVSRKNRIEQVLVAMERLKWLPDNLGARRIVANIPEYGVRVYESDTVALKMRSVVGKNRDKTPIFHDSLEYVVLRPYWNVPYSITRDEILPELREDPTYLERHNMQVLVNGSVVTDSVDWKAVSAADYKFRQRPGTYNSLGTVKFIFPNKHQVYFHDTNAKNYFDSWPRALSHGCVRIDRPQELAEFLLRDQEQWTSDSIASARSRGGQKQVMLTQKIPVWLVYLTCTTDDEGQVRYWDDIYGYDALVWKLMHPTTDPAL